MISKYFKAYNRREHFQILTLLSTVKVATSFKAIICTTASQTSNLNFLPRTSSIGLPSLRLSSTMVCSASHFLVWKWKDTCKIHSKYHISFSKELTPYNRNFEKMKLQHIKAKHCLSICDTMLLPHYLMSYVQSETSTPISRLKLAPESSLPSMLYLAIF